MTVPESPRLRFRQMHADDLDLMQSLLGDPPVMTFYDHPKSAAECRQWIDWNERGYAADGFGLWIVETAEGDFLGDCGLTWQPVAGRSLEIGYHLLPAQQGRGYAAEGATAAVEFARQRGIRYVIAIIDPANAASMRVAERAGLRRWTTAEYGGKECVIFRRDLTGE